MLFWACFYAPSFWPQTCPPQAERSMSECGLEEAELRQQLKRVNRDSGWVCGCFAFGERSLASCHSSTLSTKASKLAPHSSGLKHGYFFTFQSCRMKTDPAEARVLTSC